MARMLIQTPSLKPLEDFALVATDVWAPKKDERGYFYAVISLRACDVKLPRKIFEALKAVGAVTLKDLSEKISVDAVENLANVLQWKPQEVRLALQSLEREVKNVAEGKSQSPLQSSRRLSSQGAASPSQDR
jgi:hypothetical protein